MRYYHPPILEPVLNLGRSVKEWSITRILILMGTPLVAVVLLAMTFTTYRIAALYLNKAYARNAQTRTLAQANELKKILLDARYEIQFLSRFSQDVDFLRRYLANKPATQRNHYREIAFHGQSAENSYVLLNTGESIWKVPNEQASGMKFGVFSHRYPPDEGPADFVQIDPPTQVYYSSVPFRDSAQNMQFCVIRLMSRAFDENGLIIGTLTLSVDMIELEKVMALYASTRSPLYIFPQEKERARGFFFDAGGWLLFESGSQESQQGQLTVDSLRIGLQGDIGRPGFDSAFRPGPQNEKYWTMVTAVQTGKAGQLALGALFNSAEGPENDLFLNYAPIAFAEDPGAEPTVIGGIGCMDTSFMFKSATYEVVIGLALSALVAIILSMGAFFYLNQRISRPLRLLNAAVEKRVLGEKLSHLEISPLPQELHHLQRTINVLLQQLQAARNEVSIRQGIIMDKLHRQPVCLDEMILQNSLAEQAQPDEPMRGIVGGSEAVRSLRDAIKKAGQVRADVLIIGETGTGKELAAEAVHYCSNRAGGPFISINCGALDENLLLDVLFGHVKGAFSEAKGERKGAFLAASAGTLHLDEIGNASPKVQQALLRALSVRRIRPLGSDQDIPFDARIIAATNVDLLEYARNGTFREDLYYRLAVITINTPSLRQRREDITALVRFFLRETAIDQNKSTIEISRGALDKILQYDWPGNIRELKNCITRSVAFAEGDILLAEHINFGTSAESFAPAEILPAPYVTRLPEGPQTAQEESPTAGGQQNAAGSVAEVADVLNPRQKKAWPVILAAGGTNRAEYQKIIGEEISVRTAQYDLRDLVNKEFLVKSGKGPSQRYIVAQRPP